MRLMLAGLVLVVSSSSTSASAQTALQVKWQLKGDVFPAGAEGSSRAGFTLTNRDTKPLGGRGWAIYYSALHEPRRGSVSGGGGGESVTRGPQRPVPRPRGLGP